MNLDELSPIAWLAVMKEQWTRYEDLELMQIVGKEADRRRSLNLAMTSGEHLQDIWQQLGLKIRRKTQVTCERCGRKSSIS